MTSHHYTECGLQNVYIDGLRPRVDDEGDEIIVIPAIRELHRVIALGIVSHAHGMSGDELRFLRTEMGYTQADLARIVHRDPHSIDRWERGEPEIDSAAEAVIRRLAIERLELSEAVGAEELAKPSVPAAKTQLITILASGVDELHYELAAA